MGSARLHKVRTAVALTLLAALSLAAVASAQPTWTIASGGQQTVQANPGDQVCLSVTVADFVDILYFNAEFVFDSTVLRFDSVTNYELLTDFYPFEHVQVPDGVAPGRCRIEWNRYDYVPGEIEVGTTIVDGGRLLDLCFTVLGAEGSFSPVAITNLPRPTRSPDPFVVSANSATRDVGLYTDGATVVVGAAPLRLDVGEVTVASQSDVGCVDVRTIGAWADVSELEFFLAYNPAALIYQNAAGTLPGFDAAGVTLVRPGLLSFAKRPSGAPAITAPDGAVVTTLCFEATRVCDGPRQSSSPDVVEQDSTGLVGVGAAPTPRALLVAGGQIDVAPCDGGVVITGQPGVGSVGDRRCVGVEASGFNGVTSATFVFEFDATQVAFEGLRAYGPIEGNVTSGVVGNQLTVQITSATPLAVAKGERLFDICVEILGSASAIVDFAIDADASEIVGVAGPLSQGGGVYVVILPNSVPTLTIGSAEAPVGTEVCLQLTVEGFESLNSFRTSIDWDERVVRLLRVEDLGNLPEFARTEDSDQVQYNAQYDFKDESTVEDGRPVGKFGINWSALAINRSTFTTDARFSESLPDGTPIFELCFEIVGAPGACTAINLAVPETSPRVDSTWVDLGVNDPFPRNYPNWCPGDSTVTRTNPDNGRTENWCGLEFTTFETLIDRAATAGWNGGLLIQEGFVCSAYDDAWTLRFPAAPPEITPAGTCFKATLEDYTRMDESSFSLRFDETKFEFVSIEPVRALAPVATVDESRVAEGLIGVSLDHFRPRTLFSPSTAFELCFRAIPGLAECAPITGANEPQPLYGFANRKERNVFVAEGIMCRTSLDPPAPRPEIVREISCAGQDDAAITVAINDESRNFSYAWTLNGVDFSTDKDLTGLAPGSYRLTVTDEDGYAPEPVSVEVVVDPGPPAPIASLPAEVPSPCDFAGAVAVPAVGNDTDAFGGTISWRALDGGSVSAGGDTKTPELVGEGRFEVTVTSPGGCTATDVIAVVRRTSAAVSLGGTRELTCDITELELEGTVADHANAVELQWSTTDGVLPAGAPLDGVALAGVTEPGTYTLTSEVTETGCGARGSVTVVVNRPAIVAEVTIFDAGGRPDSLNCANDGSVTLRADLDLDGATSPTYAWATTDGALAGGTDAATAVATAVGTYELAVVDAATGCGAGATATVAESFEAPAADAGADVVLNCYEPAPTLTAGAPGTRRYDYAWTTADGELTGPRDMTTATAASGGAYVLTVTDVDNGCASTDEVTVVVDEVTPALTIDEPTTRTLTCDTDEIVLTGSATRADPTRELPTDAGWRVTPEGDFTAGATDDEIVVSAVGTFYYGAVDPVSGCRDSIAIVIDADEDRPNIDAQVNEQLDCDTDAVTLEGSGPGAGFSVSWTTDDGGELDPATADQYAATARAAGEYVLTVTNDETGCSSRKTVRVDVDRRLPEATLPALVSGDCDRSPVTLALGGEVAADPGAYGFLWQAPSTTPAPGITTASAEAGVHTVRVTRLATACEVVLETEVVFREPPVSAFEADETVFRCGVDELVLRISAASAESGQAVSWTIDGVAAGPGDVTPDGDDPRRYLARAGGAYRLILTAADVENGACVTTSAPVALTDLREDIDADVGPALRLSCDPEATVTAAPTGTDAAYTYRWSGPGDAVIVDADRHAATFSTAGTYTLTVTNPESGCSRTATLEVLPPDLSGLTADIPLEGFELGCGEERELRVDYGTPGGAPAVLRWYEGDTEEFTRSTSGWYTVSTAGRYFAEVTDGGTGCTVRDSIDVTQVTPFTADPLPTLTLDCRQSDTTATLALDNPDGLRVGYVWRALQGGAVVGAADGAEARLTPGLYEVTARDLDGACALTETVRIAPYTGWVATADAGASNDDCLGELTLRGTASDTMASRWTVLRGELPDLDPAAPEQVLLGAEPGVYRLAYELVPVTCPASEPVIVEIEIEPEPIVPFFNGGGQAAATTRDTTIQLIPTVQPDYSATLDSVSGGARVNINDANRAGIRDWTSEELAIRYEVCERDCPTRCKKVTYTLLRRRAEPGVRRTDIGLPNTITPNNDGRNERFVVDEILDDPDAYPNARFTLFNRWGDVLYAEQPYADQFDGRRNDGTTIPEGTYYYVLELDVTEEKVYQGHLTIFR